MIKLKLLLIAMLVLTFKVSQAQEGWNWGDKPELAKEKYTLFSDSEKADNHKDAHPAFKWLLENVPNLNPTLYVKGIRMHHEMIKAEKDEAKKKEMQAKTLELYNLRIKHFGDEAEVLNQKGYYILYYTDPQKYGDAFDTYEKIIKLNGNKTYELNIKNYMYLVDIMKTNNLKDVDEERVIEIHENLTKIIEHNLKTPQEGTTVKSWKEVQNYIDAIFAKIVTIDCAFIKEKMLPKLEKAPEAEKVTIMNDILARMLKAKCMSEPEFLPLAEKLYKAEPTFGRGNFLVKAYIGKGDYTTALKFLNEIIPLAETNSDKAEAIMTAAKIKQKQGSYSAARADYYKAVQTDPSKAYEAYSAVAAMYMNTPCVGTVIGGDEQQNKDSNPSRTKAKYIAAYNMYLKAGDQQGAARARSGFPTKTEVFNYGMSGKQVQLNCWIGETVTIP